MGPSKLGALCAWHSLHMWSPGPGCWWPAEWEIQVRCDGPMAELNFIREAGPLAQANVSFSKWILGSQEYSHLCPWIGGPRYFFLFGQDLGNLSRVRTAILCGFFFVYLLTSCLSRYPAVG
jgi:hypothetical protein